MRNEIYLEKYLKKFVVENSDGQVQTVFEFAPAAYDICVGVVGGMSGDGIIVAYPMFDGMPTTVVVVAENREALFKKALEFYNKIPSAGDLHRAGSFNEPEVSGKRIWAWWQDDKPLKKDLEMKLMPMPCAKRRDDTCLLAEGGCPFRLDSGKCG